MRNRRDAGADQRRLPKACKPFSGAQRSMWRPCAGREPLALKLITATHVNADREPGAAPLGGLPSC